MGDKNEKLDVVFWSDFLSTVKPTHQYFHKNYNYIMLMIKEVFCGNKLKFDKEENIILSVFYPLS